MTGAPLLLSRSRSVSYWPDVSTKNLHLRPTVGRVTNPAHTLRLPLIAMPRIYNQSFFIAPGL
jgi:hypothetical protein